MLFATNRTPSHSDYFEPQSDIAFDIQNTEVNEQMLYCQRNASNVYQHIGKTAFFNQLTDYVLNGHVIFYLHGFNCTNEKEIFPDTINMQSGFDEIANELAVKIIPLIWPCDDDHILALADDYFDDQRAADASEVAFALFIEELVYWQSVQLSTEARKKVHFLIHSMGTRVFYKSLTRYRQAIGLTVTNLANNIFLVAPDVINRALEPECDASDIVSVADNVVIYYAVDDLAMLASELANSTKGESQQRLGKLGAADITKLPENVYQVNCQDFNNRFEFIIGHRYFIRDMFNNISPVIYHLVDALEQGQITPNVIEYRLYLEQ